MLDTVTPSAPTWTYENETALERMWKDRALSSAKIGALLGGFSRNAVIGKVHRMGLGLRVTHRYERAERKPDVRKHPPEYYVELRKQREAIKAQACEMRAEGMRLYEIARRLGRSGTWVSQNTLGVQSPFRVRAVAPKIAVSVDMRERAFESHGGPNEVKITDHVEGLCRWPFGDALSENFRYCGDECQISIDRYGRPMRSSYCKDHHALAYQPTP